MTASFLCVGIALLLASAAALGGEEADMVFLGTSPPATATAFFGTFPDGATVPPHPESTTVSLESLNQCGEQTQYDTNFDLLNAVDVKQLLLEYGGPPGQINKTFPQVDPADLPLVWGNLNRHDHFTDFFAHEMFILRNDSVSDNRTYIRLELKTKQVFVRLPLFPLMAIGEYNPASTPPPTATPSPTTTPSSTTTPAEPVVVESIRGELWWRPAELCGYLRSVEYGVDGDPPNFWAFVKRRHCQWPDAGAEMRCFGPDADFETAMAAFGGPAPNLIATLVGK